MIGKISPANIRRMVKKEFLQLFRDRKLRLFIIAPPVLMLFIFGYAVNTDVNRVMIAVMDDDNSAMSRDFTARFTASPYFSYYASVSSAKEAAGMLDRGEADLFLHVERDFSRRIKKNSTGHVQAIVDGSDSTRASVIISYINSIMASFTMEKMFQRLRMETMIRDAAGTAMKGSVEVKERIYFNQDLLSGNFYLPGVIGLLIALITIMLTSMSIVKERESGTIEQINVSPLRPFEYIMGKTVPFAIVAFIDIILISVLTITWFHVPFRGSFLFLMASGFFFILSTLAVGLFISTISMTQQQAMLSSFLFFIPSILLSGYIFPVYAMPEPVQLVTYLNPMRYFITVLRSVFLKGVGITVLWPELLSMTLLGVSLFTLSVKRYSKRMD
jgi:ABC-2 type transport system permease protein